MLRVSERHFSSTIPMHLKTISNATTNFTMRVKQRKLNLIVNTIRVIRPANYIWNVFIPTNLIIHLKHGKLYLIFIAVTLNKQVKLYLYFLSWNFKMWVMCSIYLVKEIQLYFLMFKFYFSMFCIWKSICAKLLQIRNCT